MDWKNKDPKSPKDKENVTPEERLFRIISGDSGGQDRDLSQDDEIVEHSLIAQFEKWTQKVQDLFKKWPVREKTGRESYRMWDSRSTLQLLPISQILQIRKINQGLLGVVVLLALYMVADIAFVKMAQWVPSLTTESVPAPAVLNFQTPVPADLNRYLQGASKRNLFQPGAAPAPEGDTQAASTSVVVAAAPPEFKLLGISWDASGYIAMIQADPNQEGVLFVRQGDKVKGFTIEEVKESAVKFSQGGQIYELN